MEASYWRLNDKMDPEELPKEEWLEQLIQEIMGGAKLEAEVIIEADNSFIDFRDTQTSAEYGVRYYIAIPNGMA